jgi:hypothetical protein
VRSRDRQPIKDVRSTRILITEAFSPRQEDISAGEGAEATLSPLDSSKRFGGVADVVANASDASARRERESLRRRYRPDQVRILFVGEAPPVSGRFFYRGNSGLYRAIRDAFITAFPSLPKEGFLEAFRAFDCYLVDLCSRPVDHLPHSTRTTISYEGEARLARTIRVVRPMVIVTLLRSIRVNVKRAQSIAGWSGLHLELPYPGRWKRHRVEFQRQLVPILLKTLPPPLS